MANSHSVTINSDTAIFNPYKVTSNSYKVIAKRKVFAPYKTEMAFHNSLMAMICLTFNW